MDCSFSWALFWGQFELYSDEGESCVEAQVKGRVYVDKVTPVHIMIVLSAGFNKEA